MHHLPREQTGETLISVIVGVLIIALVIGSIARIIAIHYTTEDTYTRNETLYLLQNNSTNILRKLDTSSIAEKEIFSAYKDPSALQFRVMTGSLADKYKYIDRRNEWVSSTGSFQWTVYTQSFLLDRNDGFPSHKQVVKWEVRELIRSK